MHACSQHQRLYLLNRKCGRRVRPTRYAPAARLPLVTIFDAKKLVCTVARVVQYPPANVCDTTTTRWRFMSYMAWASVCGTRRHRYRSIAVAAVLLLRDDGNKQITFFRRKNLDLESDFRKFGTVAMLQSLSASLVQIGTEMTEKYAEQHPAVCGKLALDDTLQDVSALMGLVTLIFDLLTLKLVYESHQRWRTFIPNLGTL